MIVIRKSNSDVEGARERTIGFSSGASKTGISGALFSIPVVMTAGRGGMAIRLAVARAALVVAYSVFSRVVSQ